MSVGPKPRAAVLALAVAVVVLDLWSKQWAIDSLASGVHPMVVRAGEGATVAAGFAARGVDEATLREAADRGLLARYEPAAGLRADHVITPADFDLDLVASAGTGLAPPRRYRIGPADAGQTLGAVLGKAFRLEAAEVQPLLDLHVQRAVERLRDPTLAMPATGVVALRDRNIPVIDEFMSFVYVENFGAAWGFLNTAPPLLRHLLFLTISLVASCAMIWIIWTGRMGTTWSTWALGAILGGAVGNLVDRVRFRAVVDFIYNYVVIDGNVHSWPVYNVADIGISCGVILIALEMLLFAPKDKPVPVQADAAQRP